MTAALLQTLCRSTSAAASGVQAFDFGPAELKQFEAFARASPDVALDDVLDSAAANCNMPLGKEMARRLTEAGVEYYLRPSGSEPVRSMRGWYMWASGSTKEGYTRRNSDQFKELSANRRWWRIWWRGRPSLDGIIPTIEWEKARLGVNDPRYIQTLTDYVEEARSAGLTEPARAAQTQLDGLLDSVDTELAAYTATGFWRPAEYNSRCAALAQEISKLVGLLQDTPGGGRAQARHNSDR